MRRQKKNSCVWPKNQPPIDLMVTDVAMLGMSGSKLVKRQAFSYSKIKMLYMSGYTDNAIVHHGILMEGTNYIQKPFTRLRRMPRPGGRG